MLHVTNTTRDTVLVDRGRIADSFWTRFRGLMGVSELPEGDGLMIEPCKGVHCMFMSIPIDVLHVGEGDTVVGLTREMQPWRVGRIYSASQYVIELPSGSIDRTGTEVGDKLLLA